MHTLIKAIRRPTQATVSLFEGPVLAVLMAMVFSVTFLTVIAPAYRHSAYEGEFRTISWLALFVLVATFVLVASAAPGIWNRICRDQAINDASGYNKVGRDEWHDARRVEAAAAYLRHRRKRALS